MAAFNKINAFVADLANKVHNLASDSFVVALTASAHAPVATNAVQTDLTEISYTNLSSRTLTVSSAAQTSGTLKWIVNDLVLTASGTVAAFRYAAIYNNTAAGKNLVGWYDYGSDLTLNNGETLTLDFDNTNGILQIA